MNDPRDGQINPLVVFGILASIAAIAFGGLWFKERATKPREVVREVERPTIKEVIREVPVEKLVEVPKEVIKEIKVPAELSESQQMAIDFTDRYVSAKTVGSLDEALYKLDSIKVQVSLNDAVKKVLSEDRVRNKFELILRKSGVKLDDKARAHLNLTIEGLWEKEQSFLVYTPRIELDEFVVVGRKGDFRRILATLWREGSYGFAGSKVAEGAILESVDSLGERFANRFLAEQDKSK